MLNKNALSALTLAASLVLIGGCTKYDDRPFDPRALGNVQRGGTSDSVVRPLRPLPTTLESPYLTPTTGPGGTRGVTPTSRPVSEPARLPLSEGAGTVRLALREITQRAVANNLSVRVSAYAPAIEETRVTEAEARFDPTIFANPTYSHSEPNDLFNNNSANNTRGLETESFVLEAGIRQVLQSGGNIQVSIQPGWVKSEGPGNQQTTFSNGGNSVYQNDFAIQLTQPLLRDFGGDVNRARIVINKNNQRISVLDFRRDLEQLLRDTEQTYWQLVQAEREVLIQENLLQQTIDTATLLAQRIGQDVTRVQISQANASVETRRSDLIRARQQVRNFSDQLKGFMNDDEFPITSSLLLLPDTSPLETPLQFDYADLVNTAFLNRYELGQQQLRVDSASTAVIVAKNNELPVLNLVASGGLQSIGEDGYFDATDGRYEPQWSFGLQFEYPIGNRAARAIYVRSQLQRQQAIDQYRALISQVSLEISIAKREVETSWDEIVQTRKARFANADALSALQIRENAAEPLTPTFVQLKLDQQDRLATAARAEAQAISSYNIAISRLEFAKGTILRYNNVLLDEKKLPGQN